MVRNTNTYSLLNGESIPEDGSRKRHTLKSAGQGAHMTLSRSFMWYPTPLNLYIVSLCGHILVVVCSPDGEDPSAILCQLISFVR